MPDTSPTQNLGPQIWQEMKGDHGQVIGVMWGGTAVYFNVEKLIINNSSTEKKKNDKNKRPDVGSNPYKGLKAFQETDGDFFFGREQQITSLWEKLRSLHENESATRLLAIYGPSGSGKSSLVRAGLIPELARRPLLGCDSARVAVLVPGKRPLASLATILARIATEDATPITKIREFINELKEMNAEGIYDGLLRIAEALPKIATSPLIVIVDQLEEVFTLCEDLAERDAFMGNLNCATAEGCKQFSVIVTLRSDFLGTVQKYPWLDHVIEKQGVYVSAMDQKGLREAIAKPAELAGYPLDLGTVNLLIEQTEGREVALPLLQFALRKIWDGLSEGMEPAEKLNEIGGVAKALALEAEKYYDQFTDVEKLQVQRIFIQLIRPDGEAEFTKRLATRDEIGQENWNLVTRLANQRLVVTNRNAVSETETAELVHEALIREWPRLTQWMNEHIEFRTWQRRLRSAKTQWENSNKDEDALLRGKLLAEAEEWLNNEIIVIPKSESKFIELSTKSRDQKDIIRKRKNQIFKLLSISFLISTAIATFAFIDAKNQSRIANIEQKSSLALRQSEVSPIDALISGMEGGQELKNLGNKSSSLGDYPTIHPILALQTILDKIQLQNQVNTFQKGVNSITFNKNLTLMATAGSDGKVKLWKTDGKLDRVLEYPEGIKINSVRFSPDGTKIAAALENGIVQFWNIQQKSAQRISTIIAHPGSGVRNIRFGRIESDLLVTSGYDGKIKLWSAQGKFQRELVDIKEGITSAHKDRVEVVNLSDDDMFLLTGGKDKRAKLWDIKGNLITTFIGHTKTVKSAKFYPADRQIIITAGEDDSIRIWNLNGSLKRTIKGNQKGINAVDFAENQIISAGNDGTIKKWTLKGKLLSIIKAHEGRIETIRFNKDNATLVTAGQEDGTVKFWKTPEQHEISLVGHKKSVNSVRFSPNSKILATASSDGTIRLWDLTGKQIKSFPSNPEKIKGGFESVRFIDNGKYLATGGVIDGKVRIWDLDGNMKVEFDTKQNGIHSINISDYDNKYAPSDRIFSTTGNDKTVKLWKLYSQNNLLLKKLLLLKTLSFKEKLKTTRFNPNGSFMITTGENGMISFSSITNRSYKDLEFKTWSLNERHQGSVNSATFSPNGKLFVTVGDDKYVKLWSISETNSPPYTVKNSFKTYSSSLQSVNFSPDSKLLATSTNDGGVQFWTLLGQQIADFKGHHKTVRSADYSRDALRFATASEDNTAIIWEVRSLQGLLDQGCLWLKDYLDTHPSDKNRLVTCF
jgi:WD40 repeat protein